MAQQIEFHLLIILAFYFIFSLRLLEAAQGPRAERKTETKTKTRTHRRM